MRKNALPLSLTLGEAKVEEDKVEWVECSSLALR